MSVYFWEFGRCKHCNWPHHLRSDVPAKPKRWYRRTERAAYSVVTCGNCRKNTVLPVSQEPPKEDPDAE